MSTTFPKELNLEKLKTVAAGWVEEYAGYIAEISFFCSNEKSYFNLNEYEYCIDFVLCDPPRIEPVSHFQSIFIPKEIQVLSTRLLEVMPVPTEAERRNSGFNDWGSSRKEMKFLHQWRVGVRWETDQPDNSYIPESKQILYLRSKNQPTTKLIKFSQEDYDHLKQLPYFTVEECMGLMLGMPYEQTQIAINHGTLDIQPASVIPQKIKKYTELLSRSIDDGELKPREDSLELAVDDPTFKAEHFIEWTRSKGFKIPFREDSLILDTIQISKDKKLNWQDITVTFLGVQEILFQFASGSATRPFREAGFGDGRKNYQEPIKAWEILIEMSKEGGIISQKYRDKKDAEKIAQIIRKKFRALFPGIDSKTDPIPYDRKTKEYKASFYLPPQ